MKTLKMKDAAEADDYEKAIFKEYRTAELVARGHTELDIVAATGKPAVPQITTRYVQADEYLDLPVDARTEALHNRTVNIGTKTVVLKFDKAI
jgi:hypothetical protein